MKHEVEINIYKDLNEDENHILDFHTLINILNVIIGEIQIFDNLLENKKTFEDLLDFSFDLVHTQLKVKPDYFLRVCSTDEYEDKVLDVINNNEAEILNDISETVLNTFRSNFKSLFKICRKRASDLVLINKDKSIWKEYNISEIKDNLHQFFKAVEKNSKGEYRLVNNIAEQNNSDYFISVEISSQSLDSIYLPNYFIDSFRDLLANSRKYTPRGGTITAGIHNNGETVRMIVKDNGYGIPKDEISKVVDYGYRASNVRDKRTMGGGFGLTKAYRTCKNYNGRMWIRSELDRGTEIEIVIPVSSESA